MAGNTDGGPSKRPRVDECVDLTEQKDLKQLKDVEKENTELRGQIEQLKDVERENKELRDAMDELKGTVVCPVCFMVPRQGGPVPVCSNGHFLCLTCRDKIVQEAMYQQPKCPSCMVNLGNNTSLLAARLLEKVKHECQEEGCEEMIPFPDLEKHQRICQFRVVFCPGSLCQSKVPFNMVEEHTKTCADNFAAAILNDNCETGRRMSLTQTKKGSDEYLTWPTQIMSAHGRQFFARTKRQNHYHYVETVMLGSEDECKGFLASTTVLDKDLKVFTKNTSRPRPISLEKWGNMGLMLSEDALSNIWTSETTKFIYQMKYSVEKV